MGIGAHGARFHGAGVPVVFVRLALAGFAQSGNRSKPMGRSVPTPPQLHGLPVRYARKRVAGRLVSPLMGSRVPGQRGALVGVGPGAGGAGRGR